MSEKIGTKVKLKSLAVADVYNEQVLIISTHQMAPA